MDNTIKNPYFINRKNCILASNIHAKRGKKRTIDNVTPPVPWGRVDAHGIESKKHSNTL
jgi:hypothetical protein